MSVPVVGGDTHFVAGWDCWAGPESSEEESNEMPPPAFLPPESIGAFGTILPNLVFLGLTVLASHFQGRQRIIRRKKNKTITNTFGTWTPDNSNILSYELCQLHIYLICICAQT